MRRTICVVTGTRAEYGLLRPVMQAIRHRRNLRLQVLAAGMHFSKRHGSSIKLLQADGFETHARVRMTPRTDRPSDMSRAVASGIAGMAAAFDRLRPEVIVVLGDRTEALAASIAAVYGGFLLAHIHGGDISAGIDESVRHAITKLAHVHFAATPASARRVLQMGEKPRSIHIVGAPGLDSILSQPLLSERELGEILGIDSPRDVLLLIQHPVTTQASRARTQIRLTLRAIDGFPNPVCAIYPNSDSGGGAIIDELNAWARTRPRVTLFKNLSHTHYLSLLKHAAVLIGNSSSGMIESSSLGIPVVNIGIRQDRRERGKNVLDVPHDSGEIRRAIQTALGDADFRRRARSGVNPYGDGRSGERIAAILSQLKVSENLTQKQFFSGAFKPNAGNHA